MLLNSKSITIGAGCCCGATGACCNDGICTIETEADCTGSGGTYQGDDTTCDLCLCPPPYTSITFDYSLSCPTGNPCGTGDVTTSMTRSHSGAISPTITDCCFYFLIDSHDFPASEYCSPSENCGCCATATVSVTITYCSDTNVISASMSVVMCNNCYTCTIYTGSGIGPSATLTLNGSGCPGGATTTITLNVLVS